METLTAVTYNVRHAVLDDDENRWSDRRAGVVSRLRNAEPDIVALQECAGQQHEEIATALPEYEWVGVADTPGSGEHNPIGYRPALSVRDSETLWLSESGTPGSVGWDAAYPRVATEAHFRLPSGGTTLTAYSLHFDHRGKRARSNSAALLRRRVDSLPEDRPALVMGDCNAEPGEDTYDRLIADDSDRRFVDARLAGRERSGPTTTRTDFSELRPGRLIDHVFVTQGVTVRRYTVDDTRENGRYPSDHLPVVVELSW